MVRSIAYRTFQLREVPRVLQKERVHCREELRLDKTVQETAPVAAGRLHRARRARAALRARNNANTTLGGFIFTEFRSFETD